MSGKEGVVKYKMDGKIKRRGMSRWKISGKRSYKKKGVRKIGKRKLKGDCMDWKKNKKAIPFSSLL